MVSGRPSNRRRHIGLRGAIEILGRNWRIILDARHPTGMSSPLNRIVYWFIRHLFSPGLWPQLQRRERIGK